MPKQKRFRLKTPFRLSDPTSFKTKATNFARYVRHPQIGWKRLQFPEDREVFAMAARIKIKTSLKEKPGMLTTSKLFRKRDLLKMILSFVITKVAKNRPEILEGFDSGKIWISQFEFEGNEQKILLIKAFHMGENKIALSEVFSKGDRLPWFAKN
jgi:hypothetical protein